MDPGISRGPAAAGVQVIVADPAWRRVVRNPELVVSRAASAAQGSSGGPVTVVLSSDTAVKRLNARHRDRNKPTNVLTFDPAAAGLPGEIVLALATVRREAQEAGRRPAHHLAHLVVHGALHLQGHDHHHAGEARRMEMAEARILGRLGLPNPWKRG
ncbi:rRNA maturation RNase YbeY [Limobrevibacterium gyesilva]|uniref:Endoribonuclease YbeY n=1 Tax=Limobrevibacterium gyesilva TaxID=2991712 RepID=A0AA41YJ17_9PROT|nr:rRNA maturation RNase YbeY [Limobrevibacterium gyesilva]MCW3474554.1 rRNA maturation RNase YbeY [Limobrevibacterium gyesilva]